MGFVFFSLIGWYVVAHLTAGYLPTEKAGIVEVGERKMQIKGVVDIYIIQLK